MATYCSGTTRGVLTVGCLAFKFALSERGVRRNRHEAAVFGRVSARRRDMLCPMIWCSLNGAVLVQPAAIPLSEAAQLRITRKFPDWIICPGKGSRIRSNTKPPTGAGLTGGNARLRPPSLRIQARTRPARAHGRDRHNARRPREHHGAGPGAAARHACCRDGALDLGIGPPSLALRLKRVRIEQHRFGRHCRGIARRRRP